MKCYIIMIALLLIGGCAAYKESKYYVDYTLEEKLLPLNIIVPGGLQSNTLYHHFSKGIMDDNRNNPFDNFGTLKFSLDKDICVDIATPNMAFWVFSSVFTGCLLNCFGYPFMSYTSFVHVFIDVVNSSGNLIKRYSACAKGQSYIALYWGHILTKDLDNSSRSKAIANALKNIGNQMARDGFGQINRDLKKTGTIKQYNENRNTQIIDRLKMYSNGNTTEKIFLADRWKLTNPCNQKIGIIDLSRDGEGSGIYTFGYFDDLIPGQNEVVAKLEVTTNGTNKIFIASCNARYEYFSHFQFQGPIANLPRPVTLKMDRDQRREGETVAGLNSGKIIHDRNGKLVWKWGKNNEGKISGMVKVYPDLTMTQFLLTNDSTVVCRFEENIYALFNGNSIFLKSVPETIDNIYKFSLSVPGYKPTIICTVRFEDDILTSVDWVN